MDLTCWSTIAAAIQTLHNNTHCARRPSCVIVIMILSENVVEVTSVSMPPIMLAACLVLAGKEGCMAGI